MPNNNNNFNSLFNILQRNTRNLTACLLDIFHILFTNKIYLFLYCQSRDFVLIVKLTFLITTLYDPTDTIGMEVQPLYTDPLCSVQLKSILIYYKFLG